ncbi:MAG: hypothetical protein AUI10_05045 [Actinobacteria bacterium 13_2_20CM_2_72_6]|nr:MAG: hypothetical protein AUI10_05045 [Actinobacteria bacterium 13_2_20CM_2_72_6]
MGVGRPADVGLTGRAGRRSWLPDAAIAGGFLLAALLVTGELWLRPDRMVRTTQDEVIFEWMLAHAAHAVTGLHNPFFTTALNTPDGVNLMANTSALGLGVPLTPVTLIFGTHTAFLTGLVLALAGTAMSWYLFLRRALSVCRTAAVVAGAFCGFAPAMISQAGGHLNLASQFLVPPILCAVLRLGRPGRIVRGGVVLGVLVTYQVFVSEELMLFLGLAVQFLGPGHYRGLPFDANGYVLDLLAYATYPRQAIAGFAETAGLLSPNPTEENAFFGLALVGLVVVVVGWLWRDPVVKALAGTGVILAALSLGPTVQVHGRPTGLPGPQRLIGGLPLLDLAVPARYPLVVVGVVGLLLALSIDRVHRAAAAPADAPTARLPVRLIWTGAVLAVLAPLVPTPLASYQGPDYPPFIAQGTWQRFVPAGRSVINVPPTNGTGSMAGMLWSARTGLAIRVPGGDFMGPASDTDRTARYGAGDRYLGALLRQVAETGSVPPITDAGRAQALDDLRYWRAAIVVLGSVPRQRELKTAVDDLLGPGRWRDGVWLWDVTDRVDDRGR